MQRAGQRVVSQKGLVDYQPEMFEYISQVLNSRVYDVCMETPLQPLNKLTEGSNGAYEAFAKREDLQPVFSFKLRGAYNKIASLSPEERAQGIVCCSQSCLCDHPRGGSGYGWLSKPWEVRSRLYQGRFLQPEFLLQLDAIGMSFCILMLDVKKHVWLGNCIFQ